MIVKANMNTGPCYGVNKCKEIGFRKGKIIKGEGLAVLEEKMDALDLLRLRFSNPSLYIKYK